MTLAKAWDLMEDMKQETEMESFAVERRTRRTTIEGDMEGVQKGQRNESLIPPTRIDPVFALKMSRETVCID